MKAIDIIHAEHRALGAVLQAFRFVLTGIRTGAMKPDFTLLDALIEYITEVPDKLHHPKEDDVLFVKILEVVPEAAALIAKLQHDHVMGAPIEKFRKIHIDREAVAAPDRTLDLLGCSVSGAFGSKTMARFGKARIEDRC